ncbi:MAG: hypothetical protein HFK05_03550 [Clostridia bacterium]|nr:hypothetical protein [Clostridia bacterium]
MDFFPHTELERQYVNTTTTIIVVLAVAVVVLIAVLITLLFLYLKSRKRLQQLELRTFEPSRNDLSENELQVISEYRELDEQGKELVNNTIQTLNSKNK